MDTSWADLGVNERDISSLHVTKNTSLFALNVKN
jgi:hypothetical protein